MSKWEFSVTYPTGVVENVFVEGSRETARYLARVLRESGPEIRTSTVIRSESLSLSLV